MHRLQRVLLWGVTICVLAGSTRAVAQSCQTFSGLTYATYVDGSGQTQTLLLDLLVPSGVPTPIPLVIYIHGGGWSTGSRTPIPAGVSALCSRGYAVASVDYRLAKQGARWPAQLQDVKGAVRWLRAQAATYGLDPDRFAAWGWSAGAQIASVLGTASDIASFPYGNVAVDLEGTTGGNLGQSSRVQAVVSWFGYSDFLQMRFFPTTTNHDAGNSPESGLLGGPIQDNAELAATADPRTFATADDPPFLVMHGALDDLVPFHESELLTAGLHDHGVSVRFVPVPNAGHGGTNFTTAANNQTVYDFLDSVLRNAPANRVSIEATAPAAAEPGTPGTFTVSRTGSTASPLTVRWALGGTATLGADYSAPFSATLPAGVSSIDIQVRPADDRLVEGNETVTLALANDPAYRIEAARAEATVTLTDDDAGAGLPVAQIAATDPVAHERSDSGTFTISLDAPAAADLAVRYTVGGSAVNGADYAPLSGSVTIPAGASSAAVAVSPLADGVLEGTETVVLTLAASASYRLGSPGTASVQIHDADFDPAVPVVSIVATDFTASEPGTNTGMFQVTRTGSTSSSLDVGLHTGGDAWEGADYTTLPGTVTFGSGVSRLAVNVTPLSDSLPEGAETVILATDPSDPGMAFLPGPQSSAVTIADDEITGTDGFYPLPPCRLVDTRGPAGPRGAPNLSCDGSTRVFEVTGACGIPPEATALSLNIVAANPTVLGHVSLFETGTTPQTSTLNFGAGQTRANNSILPLTVAPGTLSVLCVGLSAGQVDLVVDVNGYFR